MIQLTDQGGGLLTSDEPGSVGFVLIDVGSGGGGGGGGASVWILGFQMVMHAVILLAFMVIPL